MTPIMTVEHARAVRHNPEAQRWELQQALEVLDHALDRVEARAGVIPPDVTLDWRPAPRVVS